MTKSPFRYLLCIVMVLNFFSKTSKAAFAKETSATTTAAAATTTTTAAVSSSSTGTCSNNDNSNVIELKLRSALWSFFAGDALASPTHWYYGGFSQVQRDYGHKGIINYTKPTFHLPGSILNKSNLNGGGRSGYGKGSRKNSKSVTIIGDVINHGKQELWSPSQQIHYHATLQAGENTLEVQLARVLMKSIVANQGQFDPDHFRQAYIDFMTTPNSHNDTYASTCHRMFFANLIFDEKDPKDCPDNDHHNVDTIDGLILPTIVSLAIAARHSNNNSNVDSSSVIQEIRQQAAACASVTRASKVLERASGAWGALLYRLLNNNDTSENNNNNGQKESATMAALEETARELGYRKPKPRSSFEMTACYLNSAMPAMLDNVATFVGGYSGSVWNTLLMNANNGGENVHRGSCLGAALGLQQYYGNDEEMKMLQTGLYHYSELDKEINHFVQAVMSKEKDNKNNNDIQSGKDHSVTAK